MKSILERKTYYHVLLGKTFENYMNLGKKNYVSKDKLKRACNDPEIVADFRDYLQFCKQCPDMDVAWLQHDLLIEFGD